mmetsp:Transcript_44491/g.102840  ORF Transcript_44491/g.102840 Transcript_44491/m.102840 type:complete len:99 (-) Transcript_44491:65-361(-)
MAPYDGIHPGANCSVKGPAQCLFPCGHLFCERCGADKNCPGCHERIQHRALASSTASKSVTFDSAVAAMEFLRKAGSAKEAGTREEFAQAWTLWENWN